MAEQPADHEDAAQPTMTRPDHHSQAIDRPIQADKPRRGIKRWLVRLIVLGVLLLAVVIGLGPKLLSTDAGTSLIVSLVNDRVDGELTIDSLSLRWGAGQRIEGLAYSDPAKGLQASVGAIDAGEVSLWGLIRGSRKLGLITLDDADIVYTQEADQQQPDASEDADEPERADELFSLPPGLSGSIAFNHALLTYHAAGQDPTRLTLPKGSIDMPDLRDIAFDFDATLQQGVREGRVVLKGGVLNLFDPEGVVQVAKAAYELDSQIEGLSTRVLDSLATGFGIDAGLVAELLGKGEFKASAKADGTIEQMLAELRIQTRNLFVDLYQERDGDTLIASPKSSASLRLTRKAFAKLFKDSSLQLAENRVFRLSTLQMRLPTNDAGIDLDNASMKLKISADDNVVLRDEKSELIGIDGLQIRGRSDAIGKAIKFDVLATLAAKDEGGRVTREPVKAELVIGAPLVPEREIVFFSEHLPIQLADALSGQDGKLVLWLGEMLALRVDLHGKVVKDGQGKSRVVQDFTLLPEGRVNGELVGSFDRGSYALSTKDKAPIKAVLVPEAFASLMEMLSGEPGKPLLTIDKDLPVYVTLRDEQRGEVSIVTDPSRKAAKRFFIDADRTYLGATIELPATRVYDPAMGKTYELRSGTLSVSAPDLRGKAQIKADLNLWVRPNAGSAGVPALLSWQTTVADILDSDGAVPIDPAVLMQQIALDGGVALKGAPSGLFDSLLKRDGDIASIIGPIVQDLTASFTYKDGRPTGASVRLNWDDANHQPINGAWASMTPVQFDVDSDQMLTVRGGKDIDLQVKVTEAFGDRWMGKLHPVLFDAKSGDRPIKVKIDGKSFRFPLNDPTMKGARVNAQIDLGSITFGNDALLGKLLEWTGRPGERAVFSPAKVALVDGKVSYDQFGLTVGNVQLRLDGEVDLASGSIVQMAVRVPGRSLTKVFSELEGVIAPDDFLSIPMSGSIRKPEFDRRLIVREVARLATRGLIDRQKDKLFRDLFEDLGIPRNNDRQQGDDDPKPKPQVNDNAGDQAQGQGDGQAPADEPAPVKDQIRDELIDRGLDLIFGGRRDQQKQEKEE